LPEGLIFQHLPRCAFTSLVPTAERSPTPPTNRYAAEGSGVAALVSSKGFLQFALQAY